MRTAAGDRGLLSLIAAKIKDGPLGPPLEEITYLLGTSGKEVMGGGEGARQ